MEVQPHHPPCHQLFVLGRIPVLGAHHSTRRELIAGLGQIVKRLDTDGGTHAAVRADSDDGRRWARHSSIFTLAASAASGDHCVAEVTGQKQDGELVTGPIRCYPTSTEAIFDASGGTLVLPPGAVGSVALTDKSTAAAISSFALGIHYDGASGTGASITITGSSCSGGHWNTGTAWANRISSSFNGCARLRHYDNPIKAGASQDTSGAGTTDNLTTMNNRTESVSYLSS